MPFIELRDKDNPEKLVIVNTAAIITIEAKQGTYGPMLRIILSDGKELSTSYATFQDAEKMVAALARALGENIPSVTL